MVDDARTDRGVDAAARLTCSPYIPPRPPRFLSSPTPASLTALLHNSHNLRSALILKHALEWAVVHADNALLGWLMALNGDLATTLDNQAALVEDEDGWGLVGMAIMGSCGREEREDQVRAIVTRWGLELGPNGGRDRSGWSPLHLAALLSTPPLVSFLLTRGASTHALTNRGLSALDLISGIPQRHETAILLEHAHSAELDAPGPSSRQPAAPVPDASSLRRRDLLLRRRTRASRSLQRAETRQGQRRLATEKQLWIRERASVVDVDPTLLLPPRAARRPGDSRLRERANAVDHVTSDDDSTDGDQAEPESTTDEPSIPGYDSLLVFSLPSLPSFLHVLITSYTPNCFPLTRRTVPANAIFLAAKFALYRCDDSWLEDLLEGAVEKIEQGIYANAEDLAYLAFWAYNATVLLHLLRGEPELDAACQDLGLLGMIEELINAVHVFVIRVAERRIDAVLDAALLDHETIDEFDDVRFEGEWSLFRSFTGTKTKKRGTVLPKASQLFRAVGDSPTATTETATPPSSSFASLRDVASAASPFGLRSAGRSTSAQPSQAAKPSAEGLLMLGTEQTPHSVTNILSAVLLILQLYQVNPAIIVQAFSQVFYWIACELFNRILTRKKYLCRTKAVQIKMNITALEDWVRSNALPTSIATKHLEPLTQLLAWLQCQSQLHEFDSLIGTLQSMKALNPLQMRRVIRDYRFEVNEARMSDECSQYLSQLQKDWERRKMQAGIEAIQREMQAKTQREQSDSSDAHPSTDSGGEDDWTPVDSLFDGTMSLADFVPQTSPECVAELLDSRFMIPFQLPSRTEFLVATPPSGAAYDNTLPPSSDTASSRSRPSSRTSFHAERPLGWRLPDARKLTSLPDDFFPWLKSKQAELWRHCPEPLLRESERPARSPVKIMQPPSSALSSQLGVNPLRTVSEDDDVTTPIAPLEGSTYFPRSPRSPTAPRPRQPSLQGSPVHAFAESPQHPRHNRSESYEVQLRQIAAAHLGPHSPRDLSGLSPTADKKRWFGQGGRKPSGERRGVREGSEDTIRETRRGLSP